MEEYLVVVVKDGLLGKIWIRTTYEDAVKKVVELALIEDPTLAADAVEDEARLDGSWISHQYDIWIYIAQAEED